jgi:hypothetical protein
MNLESLPPPAPTDRQSLFYAVYHEEGKAKHQILVLTQDDHHRLKRLAEIEGRSMSEIMRDAVIQLAHRLHPQERPAQRWADRLADELRIDTADVWESVKIDSYIFKRELSRLAALAGDNVSLSRAARWALAVYNDERSNNDDEGRES